MSWLDEIEPLRQVQVVQRADGEVEVRVVLARPLRGGERERLRAIVATALGRGVRVGIVEVDAVPRHPSGKFEDFVCAIEDARAEVAP